MNKIDQILFEMPGQFTRAEWIDAIARTGLSYRYANDALQKLQEIGKIETINQAAFKKAEKEMVDF